MQAVILAAGMGKRLKNYTRDNTKCMVSVNGETLIARLLGYLDRKALSSIIIVVGYQGKKLIDYVNSLELHTKIIYIDNPIYDKTNNIYSLSLAENFLMEEDTLIFESDLIFDEKILNRLICDSRKNLAVVDKFESWMDGTCMVLDERDNIVDFISGKRIDFNRTEQYYKTVNIYKFSKEFSKNTYIPFLEAYRKAKGENEYYESVIKLIAMLGTQELQALRLDGEQWYEIDDAQDLDIAQTLFSKNISEKYESITARYGGYWRYPKLLDFCYLVNPFFPSKRMMEEITSNMDILVRNYPSGMRVNTLLVSKNFNVDENYLTVGNGAAELIKELLQTLDLGKVGIIRPSFDEYANRCRLEQCEVFVPRHEEFRYSAEDIISYFDQSDIHTLILINPDNPSGNYIPYDGVKKLLDWTKRKDIQFILDESFVDFVSVEDEKTFLKDEILIQYPNLYVIKSISKSYGVPGLRLGILANGDARRIQMLKQSAAIWNINSMAEFYLQIYEKYDSDYQLSLKHIVGCREKLYEQLEKLPYVKPFGSQANYIMCQLLDGCESKKVVEAALEENILLKDLTKKIDNGAQYIRIAVRDEEDNKRLIAVLKHILEKM